MSQRQDTPFRCPLCGEYDVKHHGDGRRECLSCSWSYSAATESEQSGLIDY